MAPAEIVGLPLGFGGIVALTKTTMYSQRGFPLAEPSDLVSIPAANLIEPSGYELTDGN